MIFLKIELYNLTVALTTLLLLVILLIVGVIIYGYRNFRFLNNAQQWKRIIDEKLSNAIINGTHALHSDQEFIHLLKNKDFKKIFISVLIESDQKFVGDAHKTLKELFYTFQLDKLAWQKLQSTNTYQQVRGIQVMTAMQAGEALDKITQYLQHDNPYVYSEAQYSVVRFNGFEGLRFLDTNEKPLSQWQQMRLLQTIQTVSPSDYNTIAAWLHSKNLSVVHFALAMIRRFRIHALHDLVIALVQAATTEIRIQAIKALQAIESPDTLDILVDTYPRQENVVKVEILKFMNRAGTTGHQAFLKTILDQECDIYIQIETVHLLKKMNEDLYLQQKINDIPIESKLQKVLQNALIR